MASTIVAALLLSVAASVRGNCSVTERFFSRYNITQSNVNDGGGEQVCPGGGQCCTGNDLKALDKFAEEQMSAFLNEQLSPRHAALQRVAENLDGAVCWKLNHTRIQSDSLLRQTYGRYYAENRQPFFDFFCKLSAINQRCDNCHETVKQTAKHFLRQVILVLLKAKSSVFLVYEQYERCVFRHSSLEATFGVPGLRHFISRLQKGICNPCLTRKGIEVTAALVNAAKSPHIDCSCKQKLRCMQSCSCCSGSRQCMLQPCYNCCIDALTPCVSPDYTSLHPKFSRTVRRLRKAAKNMLENEFNPDFMLQSVSLWLSEVIMNAYTKLTVLSRNMTADCGNIRAHITRWRPAQPTVTCPSCKGNIKSIQAALSQLQDRLPSFQSLFRELKHHICSKHAAKPGVVQGCDSCSQCRTIDKDRPSTYQRDLDRMLQDLPKVFKKSRLLRDFAL